LVSNVSKANRQAIFGWKHLCSLRVDRRNPAANVRGGRALLHEGRNEEVAGNTCSTLLVEYRSSS
jgi:hypothetical protein